MARDKPFMDTKAAKPRYLVHYTDADGQDAGTVMRWFDDRLQIGDELLSGGERYRVTAVEESGAHLGLGHVWCRRVE